MKVLHMGHRIEQARSRTNPTVIGRMSSGWLVIGDRQFIPGYCLVLPDPLVPSLNDLGERERVEFLQDMSVVGDALLAVTDAYRINYSILGNTCPELHAHIFPRYQSEPEEHIGRPIWVYPLELRKSAPFDPKNDCELMSAMYRHLSSGGRISEPGPLVEALEEAPDRLELSRLAAKPRGSTSQSGQ